MRGEDVAKMLGGSIAIYVIMAACSAGSGSQSVAGNDGGGGSGSSAGSSGGRGDGSGGILDALTDPVPSANADPTQSGSRLKVRYYAGSDGSKVSVGLYDSTLDFPCDLGILASDGTTRCLPPPNIPTIYNIAFIYYSDAGCTQPIGGAGKSTCSSPPPTYAMETTTQGCGGATLTLSHYYTVGSPITPGPTIYYLSGGTCTADSSQPTTTNYYAVGAELPASTFVQVTLQTEP
jgi:hypothetical protein